MSFYLGHYDQILLCIQCTEVGLKINNDKKRFEVKNNTWKLFMDILYRKNNFSVLYEFIKISTVLHVEEDGLWVKISDDILSNVHVMNSFLSLWKPDPQVNSYFEIWILQICLIFTFWYLPVFKSLKI